MKISTNNPKTAFVIFLLLVAHLFAFNVLFTDRYPPQKAIVFTGTWMKEPYTGHWLDYVKLYFSNLSDEANFYEWSTLVLGKNFEPGYPIEEREGSLAYKYRPLLPTHTYLPYRDISFEYPPFLIFPILIPRLLANNYLEYCRYLAALLSAVYLGVLFISYKIWEQIPESSKIPFQKLLFYSLLTVLFLGQLFVTRLDIIPSFICLLSIYSFIKNRWYQAALWICLGFFTKGYTILLAPLFGIILLKEKKYKALIVCCVGIILFLLSSNLLLGKITQGHYFDSFKFHAIRGLQIESTYSSIWMLLSPVCGERIFCYSAHNCANLGSAHVQWILNLIKIIQPLFLLCFYFYVTKKIFRHSKLSPSDRNLILVESSCLLVFLFILTFKVFSAQFIIWLIPLLFLMPFAKQSCLMILFFISLLITQFLFPNFYWMLGDTLHPVGMGLLIIRNFIFILLFVELLRYSKLKSLGSSAIA